MSKILYILAGTRAEAAAYCREKGIPLHEVRFVSRPEELRGIKDPKWVVTGTFWNSPYAIRIWEVLRVCCTPPPVAPPHIEAYFTGRYDALHPVPKVIQELLGEFDPKGRGVTSTNVPVGPIYHAGRDATEKTQPTHVFSIEHPPVKHIQTDDMPVLQPLAPETPKKKTTRFKRIAR